MIRILLFCIVGLMFSGMLFLSCSDSIDEINMDIVENDSVQTNNSETEIVPIAMLWNYKAMLERKEEIISGESNNFKAYDNLINEANRLLSVNPPSVTYKDDEYVAISGDKHDFITVGKYCWPNPETEDGMPWIIKDGYINPNYKNYDATRQNTMCYNVMLLSVAYFFTDDERFAQKAVEHIKVWFIDEETLMNPNLTYAQVIPGVNENIGNTAGVIEGRELVNVISAIGLLRKSPSYSSTIDSGVKGWFKDFYVWLTTSDAGIEEGRAENNHAVAYDEMLISISLFLGDVDTAYNILNNIHTKRFYEQIEVDGRMCLELARPFGYHYSQYNLIHMLEICEMGKPYLPDLYDRTSHDGRSISKAIDFLSQYQGKTVEEFAPYKQISGWCEAQQNVSWLLYRAKCFDKRNNYEILFYKYWVKDEKHINLLIY